MGVKLQGAEIERHGQPGLVKMHPVERTDLPKRVIGHPDRGYAE